MRPRTYADLEALAAREHASDNQPHIAAHLAMRLIYRVPAEVGARVEVAGQPGVIVGLRLRRVRVELDSGSVTVETHPVRAVNYTPRS